MIKKLKGNAATLVSATLALLLSVGLGHMAHANPDNWEVEGAHGELHVFGALTEGACRIDMESARQEVLLGETPNALLRKPGNQGTPVTFRIQLRDCIRTGGRQRDRYIDSQTWDSMQPVATVSFNAPADPDSPQLMKVSGVDGIGLRLTDHEHRDVRPGEQGSPLFIEPGSSELVYTVTPERTAARLTTGEYRATVDFQLNYD